MSVETLFISSGLREGNTYDAIVVGSGITGGWAAKELCEKGLKVLLLDRGKEVTHPQYPTAMMDPWDFPHRLHLSQEDLRTHPVQSRHYSFREDNKDYYIQDLKNPYEEKSRFDWVRGDIVGGRSLLWARQCYRLSDLDFEANVKEGIGVDWPIRYKDIAPWYDYVESFIGVSGSRDGIAHLPDGNFQPPFEMNGVERYFKQKIESKFTDRKVIMGRVANLTEPLHGRGKCQSRNLCHRGCPYGAYFSSQSSTLPAAMATGRLTIRPYSFVNRILYDDSKQRATGVEIMDTQTLKTEEFYSKILFVNASTVATGFILLNSISSRFPNGLGNDSDQVGRNMMDHHKGLQATARVEGFEDQYYYGRRPAPIYVPRFRNLGASNSAFKRGYIMQGGANRISPDADHRVGAELKNLITQPGGWQIYLGAYGECLPYADNRMVLDRSKKDPWGRPMIQIDCRFQENEKAMHEDMATAAEEMLNLQGFKDIMIKNSISFPGNANHEMGTARMGKDPKTSVLNEHNQIHSVKNVFITDGSCMPSSSCVNPSLTYMALTARACSYAVQELRNL